MKKIINKYTIITFIISGLIFGSIGVGASYLYSSNQLAYSNTNTTATDVQGALDELYSKSDSIIAGDLKYNYNFINSSSTNFSTVTLDIAAGKYMVVASGKSLEYLPAFSIQGCDELTTNNNQVVNFSKWTQGYDSGRGGGLIRVYMCSVKNDKTVTLGCANSNMNFFTTCAYGFYQ